MWLSSTFWSNIVKDCTIWGYPNIALQKCFDVTMNTGWVWSMVFFQVSLIYGLGYFSRIMLCLKVITMGYCLELIQNKIWHFLLIFFMTVLVVLLTKNILDNVLLHKFHSLTHSLARIFLVFYSVTLFYIYE